MKTEPPVLKPMAGLLLAASLLVSSVVQASTVEEPPMYLTERLYHYLNAEGVGNPASAYKLAMLRFKEGDETTGERWLQKAADQGYPEACLEKARRIDGPQAREYLTVALRHGLPEAKRYLVTLYEGGEKGFPKDYRQAFVFLHDLAKQGDPEAMHNVAFYFVRGLHGVKDEVAAAHWYHQAARAGHKASAEAYAWMAEHGVGTQKDQEEAAWYRGQLGTPFTVPVIQTN